MSGLKTTIKEKGKSIDDIFSEVSHGENLNLPFPSQLHLYHLIVRNNRFSTSDLEKWLYRNLSKYVFSRARLEQFRQNDDLDVSVNQAIHLMLKSTDIGEELGEMLLYAFLEGKLGAPKLMSRIELTTDLSKYGSESKGIYFRTFTDATGNPQCQMIFGVSDIVGGLRPAIDSVFEAIIRVENHTDKEIDMVEKTVLQITDDEEELEAIENLILPQPNAVSKYDTAYGIFLGYTLGIEPNGRTKDEYEDLMTKKMIQDIKNNTQYIVDKINNNGLGSHSFYFYILPFDNADDNKDGVMKNVLKGGVSL